jgi:hypothetical protein
MIPWWGWLVLWASLVLVLLLVLALSGWLLFRKFVTLLDSFGRLAESTFRFDRVDTTPDKRPQNAILAPLAEVRLRRHERVARANQRRDARRRARLVRGRAIVSVDPKTIHLIDHRDTHNSNRR